MHQAYVIGTTEKHRIDIHVNWLTLIMRIAVDKKTIFRRPLFFKVEHSFEVGPDLDHHLIRVVFNLFDYYRNTLHVTVNGQQPTDLMILNEKSDKVETPIDDAASALLFLFGVNVIFSVVGTLFPPDISSLNNRMLLLLGGMVYLLLAVKTLLKQAGALVLAMILFSCESIYMMIMHFNLTGLVLRVCIMFYLVGGFRSIRRYDELQQMIRGQAGGSSNPS